MDLRMHQNSSLGHTNIPGSSLFLFSFVQKLCGGEWTLFTPSRPYIKAATKGRKDLYENLKIPFNPTTGKFRGYSLKGEDSL